MDPYTLTAFEFMTDTAPNYRVVFGPVLSWINVLLQKESHGICRFQPPNRATEISSLKGNQFYVNTIVKLDNRHRQTCSY